MDITDFQKYLSEHPVKTILLHLENSLNYVELLDYLGRKDLNLILLNPRELASKILEIHDQTKIDLVLSHHSNLDDLPVLSPDCLFFPKFSPSEDAPEFMAQVSILSSGTENLKLWTFKLQDLFHQAKSFVSHFSLNNANFILSISFASIAGLNLLLRAWQARGSIEFELEEALSFDDSVVSLFPTQLRLWYHQDSQLIQKLESAQIIFLGGEPLDAVSEKIIQDYNLPVVITYALTEAGGTVACKNIFEEFYQAIPGYAFKVIETADSALQDFGQLAIIKQTESKEIEILTNDFVELLSDTQIKSISRRKTFVNRGGFKFQISHLESLLGEEFQFKHLACLKVSDADFGEKVICAYQGQVKANELDSWSKANLAVYMQPEFREFSEWPVLPNGKTDIRTLLA